MTNSVDVLIIGAGVAGIGVACHLTRDCPDKSFAVLERRQNIGGTWDLFRFPGIRTDSDVFSYGYEFRPWDGIKVMVDGETIREYLNDSAREYGVDKKVRFGLKILRADWKSESAQWTVTAREEATGEEKVFFARVLICCTGYYNYDQGYTPHFPGQERFQGPCIHPQQWPEALEYKGKRVVIIGSGATAVTLVPALAIKAAHVTMLQRSPSYILALPGLDTIARTLGKFLPKRWVYRVTRARYIRVQRFIYKAAKRWPHQVKKLLLWAVKKQLGGTSDMRHFTPRYEPWDERLCIVPDGDLFKSIRSGKASVVTDEIETFTERGVLLKSGGTLDADIIITATGLNLQTFGGMAVSIDGESCAPGKLMTYKSLLLQDVPNFAWIMGYINSSWTLKVGIAADYLCKVLKHMDQRSYASFVARAPEGEMQADSIMSGLSAGYVRRSESALPRQGRSSHWRMSHAYEVDRKMLVDKPIDDGCLQFSSLPAVAGLNSPVQRSINA